MGLSKNMTVDMSHIRTDKDRVELFHSMIELIKSTIKDAKKNDYISMNVVKKLDDEDIHYTVFYHHRTKRILSKMMMMMML